MLRCTVVGLAAMIAPASFAGLAIVWDIETDWSETQNPNGVWTLLEAENPLPHLDAWQMSLGGWAQPQPGWAESSDGNNRLPFFFRSNGSETFANDIGTGDLCVHTHDPSNGVGNGDSDLRWTAPYDTYVRVSGEVWMGRDIGRANDVSVQLNNVTLTTVAISSGDVWSSANPRDIADGGSALNVIRVAAGDTIDLHMVRAAAAVGDFMVFRFRVEDIGCPPDLSNDGEISFPDLNLLLGQFNQTGENLPADINDDGTVNFADLNLILSAFNLPCPEGA